MRLCSASTLALRLGAFLRLSNICVFGSSRQPLDFGAALSFVSSVIGCDDGKDVIALSLSGLCGGCGLPLAPSNPTDGDDSKEQHQTLYLGTRPQFTASTTV